MVSYPLLITIALSSLLLELATAHVPSKTSTDAWKTRNRDSLPQPTALFNNLPNPIRRQEQNISYYYSAIAGFVTGDGRSPIQCSAGATFMQDPVRSVAGCCTQDSTADYANCHFPTACIPSSLISVSCDRFCSSDIFTTLCTNSSRPHCVTNNVTDWPPPTGSLLDIFCWSTAYNDTVTLARVPTKNTDGIELTMMERIWGIPESVQVFTVTPDINNVTTTFSTAVTTSNPTEPPAATSAAAKGLTKDQSINLGVGLGVGLPSMLATLAGLFIAWKRHQRRAEQKRQRLQRRQTTASVAAPAHPAPQAPRMPPLRGVRV